MSVVVLVGSEMGTAELAADAIAKTLARDHAVSVHDMYHAKVELTRRASFVVLVCSTYGTGEFPTGAEMFFDVFDTDRPDLTGLRFAVFGLGDSVYGDTFNRAGEMAAEKFAACGAVQVGEHARHDASTEVRVVDMAQEWATRLSPLCRVALASVGSSIN
ncbi:flavodoxin domain-containing protein [Skermania piniformis]|uniref:Flavodoxin domain-containing protein n=1 Tax=Skermania pinensis TaxID=39122 RepID=A0ABX8S678_9ACTN|nr:flavodoxin domain-containing protein [Skermania piniformis]QXQ13345.1 flavodoxin domain-containing protein [Skermania piniformis]